MTAQKVGSAANNLERGRPSGFLTTKIRTNRTSNGVLKPKHWIVSATLAELINYLGMAYCAISLLPAASAFSVGGAVFVRLFFQMFRVFLSILAVPLVVPLTVFGVVFIRFCFVLLFTLFVLLGLLEPDNRRVFGGILDQTLFIVGHLLRKPLRR